MPISRVGAPAVFLTPENKWVLGKVTSYDSRTSTYSCSATDPIFITVHNLSSDTNKLWLPRADTLNEDVDDLLELTDLHEASLLFCLKKRYIRDVVYTNIGPIVIALNPFNYSISWYVDSKMGDYLAEGVVIEKNLPHLWSAAHNAYWEMRESGQNQSVLISGESGAGKTEAAKILLKYFGALSAKNGTSEDRENFIQVNRRVLAASPILESFGNAKTVRNDNSSRFGKFLRVQFNADGILVGCYVTKYLLEKSRIIGAAAGERVYHSYYQLAQGPLAKEFSLRNPRVYRVLNAGECIHIDDVDDALEYASTKQAMDDVGIAEEEQMSIWRIVAGVVFLQNTDFVETEESSGRVARVDSGLLPVLNRACELWGINEDLFKKELVSTSIVTQKEQTLKPLNKVKALDARDSICKSLYSWLFGWLVAKINETTNREEVTAQWIGLLDIFGFENFRRNGFEQLCINLANEVIQGHYNRHIFTLDMRECQDEGIDTTHVKFADNKECVDLLMGRVGIFTLLDEECAVSGNQSNYLQKLVENFGNTKTKGGNAYFLRATGRALDNHFIIRHYAADVQYNVDDFLDKNRDTLKPTMKQILAQSKVPLISAIVQVEEGKTSSNGTVGAYFIKQLVDLISVINHTNPHWIRCIKPNAGKQPRVFSDSLVMEQLRAAGILETIKIRKAGYPIRFKFDELVKRYRVLCQGGVNGEEACKQILQNCDIDAVQAQLGKTKVFMKYEAYVKLSHAKEETSLRFTFFLQAVGRGSLARGGLFAAYVLWHRQRIMEEKRIREEALRKQRELEEAKEMAERAERERKERFFKEQRYRAAVSIQRLFRGFLSRKKFFIMYLSVLRAREEHARDDEHRKYRDHEINMNRRMRALEAQMCEQKGIPEKFTTSYRRELLRERRERTMQLLKERRLINELHLEEEVAREKIRRAKERVKRKQHLEEELKLTAQERQNKANDTQRNEQRRYFNEMLNMLGGNVEDSNRKILEPTSAVEVDRRHEDVTFVASRQHWEEKERWEDEREFLLGSLQEAHGLTLTSRQRQLEDQYRVQAISKVMWQSEAKKAAISFRQQRAVGNGMTPHR